MQTSIFEAIILHNAGKLLDALNDGATKKKELYHGQYAFTEGAFTIFMAANAEKILVFNILDEEGNIPSGFSANWRDLNHIKQDLQIQNFTK